MKHYFFVSMLAKLLLLVLLFVRPTFCYAQQDKSIETVPRKTGGQSPKVPTVESMLNPDPSIERYLSRTPSDSAYEKDSQLREDRNRVGTNDQEWNDTLAGWTSPEFYTRPLYFEQVQFERYRSSIPEWTRPGLSYAQFLSTVPLLPYKMGTNGPRDRIYTVGHYPKDQITPPHSSWGKQSKRGMLLQGVATTGLILLIP